MIRSILLVAAMLASTACAPLSAQPLVRMDVVDRDTGQWLPGHRHRHELWIAGMPGHRYGVRLTNTTGERVLVVLSVDGVNAVTGQTAHPAQTGYVLDAWQSAEIAGWRKSYDDIAQFVFTALPDSYAARTGRPDNVGTIGIAVFRERQAFRAYPQPMPPIARRGNEAKSRDAAPAAAESEAADSAYGSIARQQQQRIGTGHGQREWSPVGQASFVRATTRPAQLTQLRYDSPQALVAMGVLAPVQPHWSRRGGPDAFPGGFVADPPRHEYPAWR